MITLMFTTSSSIGSRLIRWLTKSPASHTLIGGLEVCGVPVVVQANVGGIQITPRDRFLAKHPLVVEYEVLPDVSQELNFAIRKLGDGYNYLGLFGYIPVLIGKWWKLKVSNPFRSSTAQVCSEFVCDIFNDGPVPEFLGMEPSSATPRDLIDRCEGNLSGSFRKLTP